MADIDRSVAFYRGLLGSPTTTAAPRRFAADPELQQLYHLPGGRESASVVRIPGSTLSLEFVEWRDVERSPVQPRVQDPVLEFKRIDRKRLHSRLQDPGTSMLQLSVRDIGAIVRASKAAGGSILSAGGVATLRHNSPIAIVGDANNFFLEPMQPAPQAAAAAPREPEWVTRSNANAQILIRVGTKYNPEGASREGVAGLDEEVTTFPPDRRTRFNTDVQAAAKELQQRFAAEKDPSVAQDLRICRTTCFVTSSIRRSR